MKKVLLLMLLFLQLVTFAQFDPSFDSDGIVLPPYPLPISGTYFSSSNRQMGLLADGKILTFGSASEANGEQVLRRYLTDGSVDASFGNDGIKRLVFKQEDINATTWRKCAFLSNGKVLLVNYSKIYNTQTASIRLTQLNADGSIHTTYGTNGFKDISNAPYLMWSVDDLQFLPDGRIYIIGTNRYNVGTDYYFLPVVIGLSSSHDLDASFGNNGVFTPESLGTSNFLTTPKIVHLSEDGSLLINTAGSTGKNLIKMTPNGQIDSSFGINGIKTTDKIIYNLIPVGDNKFWGCGPIALYDVPVWNITRYNSDLSIDASFGTNGSAVGSFGKVVVQPDGKVVTIQTSGTSGFITSYTSFVKRYNTDGAVDKNYQILFGENASKQVSDITLQPDGKILVCGGYQYPESNMPYYTAPWLARLLPALESSLDMQKYTVQQTSVYPNPFNENLTLSYELEASQKISIDLIDLQGRIIQEVCYNKVQSGSVKLELIFPGLSAGTYILKIKSATGMQKNIKIVKN